MEQLDFSILGREYSVSVKPEERAVFLAAVELVDTRMRELEARTHAGLETLSIMTAINFAHEMLESQRSGGLDLPAYKRRMQAMGDRIDKALETQENLF
ncbi:MAG: cell division protein ZapA [Betaproteobacteria bacterium]|nr:cell division protein ZapA [Betaproteobacteria bacterium]